MLVNPYMHCRVLLVPMTEVEDLVLEQPIFRLLSPCRPFKMFPASISGGAVAIVAGILVTIIPMVLLLFVVGS